MKEIIILTKMEKFSKIEFEKNMKERSVRKKMKQNVKVNNLNKLK